jgi:EAL domain-containing protein (putative c-di-GMP-specific phosphodiesterase class I)
VKLDTALTRNLDNSMPRQMIVEGVVRLARAKGFTIIAQDVAQSAELSALYALGIRHLQSYWIAPAVDETRLRAAVGPRTEPRREPRNIRITRTRQSSGAETQDARTPAMAG